MFVKDGAVAQIIERVKAALVPRGLTKARLLREIDMLDIRIVEVEERMLLAAGWFAFPDQRAQALDFVKRNRKLLWELEFARRSYLKAVEELGT